MKKLVIGLMIMCFAGSTFAALPTFYNDLRVVKAIVNSPEFVERFKRTSGIEKIEKTDQGYKISSTYCALNVEVIYFSLPVYDGPVEFELRFGDLFCWFNRDLTHSCE